MAITSYNSKVIYKEHSANQSNYAGTWHLLLNPDNIPSPSSAPNSVEVTSLLDDTQTFLRGIKTSSTKEISGNLEASYLANLTPLAYTKLDIMHLYGTDGIGGVSKWVYESDGVAVTVNDIGGNDEAVKISATLTPYTQSTEVVNGYTVTDNGDGTFTVAVKSGS